MSLIKTYLHSLQSQTMAAQFYTLNMLKDRVDSMIKEQGENAPVAYWIYTSEDVITFNDDGDEVYYPKEVNERVLTEVHEGDYIFEQISECIEDEINRIAVGLVTEASKVSQ